MYAYVPLSLLLAYTALALPRPLMEPDVRAWLEPKSLKPSDIIDVMPHETESKPLATDNHSPGVILGTNASDKDVAQEELAGVYYCDDIAWGGLCTYLRKPIGGGPDNCTTIGERASSIGPDPGIYCIFYTCGVPFHVNSVCDSIASDLSDQLTLSFPGSDDLTHTAKGDYNDNLRSYHCFKEEVSFEHDGPMSIAAEDGA
ncbi:hypothetical protein E8E13_009350 [Curvularia kusanoi]|uniref:Uncharacterized protein n=1 Tax=Curvularia kusanoi TaxID=90978 RepID=A0A9P4TM70_CURKU|nr:hypothetical protein E8E13_009350 [Curvularia kusanoi]